MSEAVQTEAAELADLLARIEDMFNWLRAIGIDELELTCPSGALRLRRSSGGAYDARVEPAGDPGRGSAATVTAHWPGIFLDRHPLHADPLVAPGARVKKGAPIGFLRAGPLLMIVPAPVDGVIAQMLARHGDIVGFGAPLLALDPNEGAACT